VAVHPRRARRSADLYFAHQRACIVRDGLLFPISPFVRIDPADDVQESKSVPHRGDMTCTRLSSDVRDVDGSSTSCALGSDERGSRWMTSVPTPPWKIANARIF